MKTFSKIKKLGLNIFIIFSFSVLSAYAVWDLPSAVPTTISPLVLAPFNISTAPQQKAGALIVEGGFRSTGPVILDTTINIPIGAQLGKVLTSDASGNATWQTPTPTGWTYTSPTIFLTNNTDNLVLGTNSSIYKSSVTPANIFIHNTGTNNFFSGLGAGQVNTGAGNTGVGANSLNANTSGSNNTAIGYNSLTANTTGSNNTAIGSGANVGSSGLSNATAIGYNALVSASNSMVFGNSSVTGWGFGVQPAAGNAIQVGTNTGNGNGARLTVTGTWTSTSDLTKKHNIQNLNLGLNEILKLRPVSFNWNGTNQSDIGLIAQEVKEVLPEIVYGKEGDYTVGYSQLTPILTKAIQEQQEEIEGYRKELEDLKIRLNKLQEE